jgi:hypothetical protein
MAEYSQAANDRFASNIAGSYIGQAGPRSPGLWLIVRVALRPTSGQLLCSCTGLNTPDGSCMRSNRTSNMADRVVIHQCQATLFTLSCPQPCASSSSRSFLPSSPFPPPFFSPSTVFSEPASHLSILCSCHQLQRNLLRVSAESVSRNRNSTTLHPMP